MTDDLRNTASRLITAFALGAIVVASLVFIVVVFCAMSDRHRTDRRYR